MRQKRTSPSSRLHPHRPGCDPQRQVSGAVLAGLCCTATGFVSELAILSGRRSAIGHDRLAGGQDGVSGEAAGAVRKSRMVGGVPRGVVVWWRKRRVKCAGRGSRGCGRRPRLGRRRSAAVGGNSMRRLMT